MILETFPVGALQCNCTIIGDENTGEAIVIDPGDEVTRIHRRLMSLDLKLRQILVTHAHIDHVGGLAKLYQYTGAPVMMHSDDLPLYRGMEMQAAFLGIRTPELTEVHQLLKEGDILQWGDFFASVLHTPGHSPGSVSLYLPNDSGNLSLSQPQLFSGDTLFSGSIGRTDLWGGSYDEIVASLKDKLLQLPDSTIVHPGHGASTTIGHERDTNPFLK